MCKKCIASGRMSSLLIMDNENDLMALQLADDNVIAGVILGPLSEEIVSLVEDFAKQARQHLTLQQAEPAGKAH